MPSTHVGTRAFELYPFTEQVWFLYFSVDNSPLMRELCTELFCPAHHAIEQRKSDLSASVLCSQGLRDLHHRRGRRAWA